MRDQQRQKLYTWQRQFGNGLTLELKECQKLINRISKHYKTHAPQVTDGRGRRSACYCPGSHTIKLPRWARNERVVIHEIAHCVADAIARPKTIADHGREFVGVYMYLLNKYMGIPVKELAQSANKVNLDFASAQSSKPERK